MPMVKYILSFIFIYVSFCPSIAQQSEAKDYIISGNDSYKSGDFAKAEVRYKQALSEDVNSLKANYNLGNALYRQKKFDEARTHYDKVIHQSKSSKADKQKAYHNIGKSYLDENNPEKAVQNFKEALKLNPYDEETRYNYALARKLLEKQQQNQDKNSEDKNQDQNKQDSQDENQQNDQNQSKEGNKQKDENQNSQKDQNQGNQPNQNNQGNQQGGENGNEKGEGNQPQQQPITKGSDGKGNESPNAQNPDFQEGVLEGLRQQEQETLKKIISQKAQKTRTNTEKDW